MISKKTYHHREQLHWRIVGICITCFIIVAALSMLFRKDRAFSDEENRVLASRPAFALTSGSFWKSLYDGSFSASVDAWAADQFPLRDTWMKLQFTTALITGQKEFSDIYIGENGYLLAEPALPQQDREIRTADAMNSFCMRHDDMRFYTIFAPVASQILTDKLPRFAKVHDQRGDIADFQEMLLGSFKNLDVGSVLDHHKDELIYYRTDHHWTSYGAFLTFQAAAGLMQIDTPNVWRCYPVTDSFQGTLASRSGDHRSTDIIHVYMTPEDAAQYYVYYPATRDRKPSMFETAQLEEKDKYTVFFGGNHPEVEIVTTADTGRQLLVFKDSYANCFMQFLTPYFDKIVMIDPRYYYENVETLMTGYDFTDVLFLYCADTILTDTSLADTLTAE